MKLDENKATSGEIPLWLLKDNCELTTYICRFVNDFFTTGEFPDSQKLANVTPIFKKGDPLNKTNYRPVSVLPLISKVIEKIIYNQVSEYMQQYLNSLLCGFREGYSTQHALLNLLQSWQNELDLGGHIVTILMDLSKAYDCLAT